MGGKGEGRSLTLHGAYFKLQGTEGLPEGDGRCHEDLRAHKTLSCRRAIFPYRSNSTSVAFRLLRHWRKRRYPAHFVSKLSDSEGEAEETRVWLEFSWRCGYMSKSDASELDTEYDQIIGQLVRMIDRPDQWVIDTNRIRRA